MGRTLPKTERARAQVTPLRECERQPDPPSPPPPPLLPTRCSGLWTAYFLGRRCSALQTGSSVWLAIDNQRSVTALATSDHLLPAYLVSKTGKAPSPKCVLGSQAELPEMMFPIVQSVLMWPLSNCKYSCPL